MKPKIFAISPTMLGKFNTCPRSYEGQYVTKEVEFSDTLATVYGSLIHKGIEDYLNGDANLPEYSLGVKPLLDYIKGLGLELIVEGEYAVNREYKSCKYGDKEAWVRCKADLVIFDPINLRAIVIDWKTDGKYDDGEKYGDKTEIQRNILAMCVGIHYNVQELTTMFVYVKHDKSKLTKYDFSRGVAGFISSMGMVAHAKLMVRFEEARELGVYPPKKNGFCKANCGVYSCEYNGRTKDGSETCEA